MMLSYLRKDVFTQHAIELFCKGCCRLFFKGLKQRRPLALILTKLQALSSVTGLLCFMFFERKELSSRLFFKSKTKEAIGAHFERTSSPLQRHWPPLFYVFFLKKRTVVQAFFKSIKQKRPLALILTKLQAFSSVTGLLCFMFFERGKRSSRLF